MERQEKISVFDYLDSEKGHLELLVALLTFTVITVFSHFYNAYYKYEIIQDQILSDSNVFVTLSIYLIFMGIVYIAVLCSLANAQKNHDSE